MADEPDHPNGPNGSGDTGAGGSGGVGNEAPQAGQTQETAQAQNTEQNPQQNTAQNTPQFDKIGVLGHAAWVMSQSDEFRHLFLTDMEWRIMPPVALDQFRIWRQGNMPVAFATWAYVGPRQIERLDAGITRLTPTEWRSGPTPRIIDIIAPFGGREDVERELNERGMAAK